MAYDYTKIKMKFTMENLGDGDRSVTVEKKFNEEGRPYLDLRRSGVMLEDNVGKRSSRWRTWATATGA